MIATVLNLVRTVIFSLYITFAGGDKSTLNNDEGYNRQNDKKEAMQTTTVNQTTTVVNVEKGIPSTSNTNEHGIVGVFIHILGLLVNSVENVILDHLGITLAVTFLTLVLGIYSRFS